MGGIQDMLDSLTYVKSVSNEDKERALKSMNSEMTEVDEFGNFIPDMPETLSGGISINLLRANLDEADEFVKEIDAELTKMDKRRQLLLLEKEAYQALHDVAVKYTQLISDFNTRPK